MNWLSSDEDGIGDNGIPRVPRGLRLFARNVGAREVAEEERGTCVGIADRGETLFRNMIGMLSWCFATFWKSDVCVLRIK